MAESPSGNHHNRKAAFAQHQLGNTVKFLLIFCRVCFACINVTALETALPALTSHYIGNAKTVGLK
jgi:hypothetical protein